jgi:hypothetical protein
MHNYILIRLYPTEPTTVDEFKNCLNGLSITAYDISYAPPNESTWKVEAKYLPGNDQNRIFQHFKFSLEDLNDIYLNALVPINVPIFQSVATAIIQVPDGMPEYKTSDIRLEIKRNNKEIFDQRVDYNAYWYYLNDPPQPISSVDLGSDVVTQEPPATADQALIDAYSKYKEYENYLGYLIELEALYLSPAASIYFALPSPYDLGAHVEIPTNGIPPIYEELKEAILQVLNSDPGFGKYDLAELDIRQSKNVAYEIIWDRQKYPLPVPPNSKSLEDIYTSPDSDSLADDRQTFENDLKAYYATHNSDADRLTGFVYSLSAAVYCEQKTRDTKSAGFQFPVLPEAINSMPPFKETEVIISNANVNKNLNNLGLDFTVPAEYFYALGAMTPTNVTPDQRYRMACLEKEQNILSELTKALDSYVISDPSKSNPSLANPHQAARRLHCFGIVEQTQTAPECPIDDSGSAANTALLKALIKGWLDFPGDDIDNFWKFDFNVNSANNIIAHMDLILCAVLDNHKQLIANDNLAKSIKGIPIINAFDLAKYKAGDWREFFLKGNGRGLLPAFTAPGTPEERLDAFIRRIQKFFDTDMGIIAPVTKDEVTSSLDISVNDPVGMFIRKYDSLVATGADDFEFGKGWDKTLFSTALENTPIDDAAKKWLLLKINTINELYILTDLAITKQVILPPMHFSLMEALYSRGFISADNVINLDPESFEEALTGTVAYQYADDIYSISFIYKVTNIADIPLDLHLSLMGVLYSLGLTSKKSILELQPEEFKAKLPSTASEYASSIYSNAKAIIDSPAGQEESFKPINPDGSLVNCIPPYHLSPLGPSSYLNEMLKLWDGSTCESPFVPNIDRHPSISELPMAEPYSAGGTSLFTTLDDIIAKRRGDLGALHVTRANLETPIPLIDIVNECLEFIAANPTANTSGIVYDTAKDELADHALRYCGSHEENEADKTPFHHDPYTLFAALPEHSSPATPVPADLVMQQEQGAYDNLKKDFSSPLLPYSQPLDICRSYLRQMGTNRYAVMRRFRKDITEFVLDPNHDPADFQAYLWRYPVKIDISREYLGITPEEYERLFTKEIYTGGSSTPSTEQLILWELYGFYLSTDLMPTVTKVPEFLKRTGLTYCEFLDLKSSEFVKFKLTHSPPRSSEEDLPLPDCEPCCLDNYWIHFIDPATPEEALKRLAVFIRLWHKLQDVDGARYSFWQLRDICEVLHLFKADSTINPDFIRQMAAFQILRDHLGLRLTDDDEISQNATGADRTHLLALWIGSNAKKWPWAVDHLLDRIQFYAKARHGHGRRSSRFIKLLEDNLDPLSLMAGFNPNNPEYTWHAYPTHTLRFVEVLSKIYASKFGVGEILYLFTAYEHLDGDDPYPLQDENESLDSPLGLPDNEEAFSLWSLRHKLLSVEVTAEEPESWTWTKIDASLRNDFGYVPPKGSIIDPLVSLGEHFFPSFLETSGHSVNNQNRQYRVDITSTPPLMWNTPLDGPFQCDPSPTPQLWTKLPLKDEEVIAKLSRIRQLNDEERRAVQELYFLPRKDLALFGFIFSDLDEADRRLIQEADEKERWSYFRREFARFHKRCNIIAEHLAEHIVSVTGQENSEGIGLAWCLLKHLLADENRWIGTKSWEDDDGKLPDVTWKPQPNGGAFAAILGLTGTGLLGEFTPEGGNIAWRGVCGPMNAFGQEENVSCSPVPTVIPSMDLQISWDQKRFVNVRNGFALSDPDGQMLGSAQGFTVCWQGALLIDKEGTYEFWAGAPTPAGEKPDFEAAEHHHWRVILKRGQKTWVLISHHWPDEHAPAVHSTPLPLKRGAYHLSIQFKQKQPEFSRQEGIRPRTTGFQLKYSGPDSLGTTVAIPLDKLFLENKDSNLSDKMEGISEAVKAFLDLRFISTLRDIRRTYQRAFKALLFAHRFSLSAKPVSDDGQSEIEYMLAHTDKLAGFAGTSYYLEGVTFKPHYVDFDFNFLPILDSYHLPSKDQRADPSVKRKDALFDWWERIFDYSIMRQEAQFAPEHPVWLLFHEAAEVHPDDPAHSLRHMGIDIRHDSLVFHYWQINNLSYDISSGDLEDERWPIRIWQAEKWIRALLWHFAAKDIRYARTYLWASDDPSYPITIQIPGKTLNISGNKNLTKFFRDGCIENGEPRRYEDIKHLNDNLREKARQALLAYLCCMKRVPLLWLGLDTNGKPKFYAEKPTELSDLLLLDVEAGICERASRIDEAISAVQTFIRRCRLGLETDFVVSPEFALMWDRHFATFQVWEACKRREIYPENWIEWIELEKSRRIEAFRFLESELRKATLTIPVSSSYVYWPDQKPPIHPGLTPIQEREPAMIQGIPNSPDPEGYTLLGSPERYALPSWLAAVKGLINQNAIGNLGPFGGNNPVVASEGGSLVATNEGDTLKSLPFWMEAAIKLGIRFIRIAAAGEPPASAIIKSQHRDSKCCAQCGMNHPVTMDEYYFWLIDSRYFKKIEQGADWHVDLNGQLQTEEYATADPEESGWHNPNQLPKLLQWGSEPMVHLAWCRIHNGEFQQFRWSDEGVRISQPNPQLKFEGRSRDSLRFSVVGGEAPTGYSIKEPPGFRYYLATDSAIVLPIVVGTSEIDSGLGGLSAYPYFIHFAPGARLLPSSLFSPALLVAGWLRTHCRFEASLKWYELVFNPLKEDCNWCSEDDLNSSIILPPIGGEYTGVIHSETAEPDKNGPCCQYNVTIEQILQHRSVTLYYLETLLQWGNALMHRNTPEAFQQARLIFDTAARILGPHPLSVIAGDKTKDQPQTIIQFSPRPAPLNPRLLAIYDLVDDRLSLIHSCLNGHRLHIGHANKDMPYFGNISNNKGHQTSAQVCHSWQVPDRICPDEDWCCPYSPYRFIFLVKNAQEIANEVRGFGAALLSAFEKGDAEYLASLRAGQEHQLLDLALVIRQNQWRDADWQVQALRKSKEETQTRKNYYDTLIKNGPNLGENQYIIDIDSALGSQEASRKWEDAAAIFGVIPDLFVGTGGLTWQAIGTKMALVSSTKARIDNSDAESYSTNASLDLTQAGWDRRLAEWNHQVEVLGIEIEMIERQILAAERRRDIALRELNNHQQQKEHTAEVHDFLRDKFTDDALYLYLQKETAALHYQMYELALHTARQAQKAFNYERGYTDKKFVPSEAWNNLHEGLMAGERLSLALRRMEKAYLDENIREYELTKQISVRLHFPLAFLHLRATGYCELDIPEWMFDQDYPGHYMRRIKSVTLTLPCSPWKYSGVHCRLTLLRSTTRVDPLLKDPTVPCCGDRRQNNRYSTMPNDSRIINMYAATEAIATSSGQNDSGLFELSFRDERYLPFEFAGAISRWRIELPKENNQFPISKISDVILQLNYTAREGGDMLRKAANQVAQQRLSNEGMQFFDVRYDLSDDWNHFQRSHVDKKSPREFNLKLGKNMFPYTPGGDDIEINRLELFFKAKGEDPSAQKVVEFLIKYRNGQRIGDQDEHVLRNIYCETSAEWPGLYHGILNIKLRPLDATRNCDVGTFRFPFDVGDISDILLFCSYRIDRKLFDTGMHANVRAFP